MLAKLHICVQDMLQILLYLLSFFALLLTRHFASQVFSFFSYAGLKENFVKENSGAFVLNVLEVHPFRGFFCLPCSWLVICLKSCICSKVSTRASSRIAWKSAQLSFTFLWSH